MCGLRSQETLRGAVWAPDSSLLPHSLSTTGQDVVETILAHLKVVPRTRKQVIHHLVRMGLADSVKEFQKR